MIQLTLEHLKRKSLKKPSQKMNRQAELCLMEASLQAKGLGFGLGLHRLQASSYKGILTSNRNNLVGDCLQAILLAGG